jgi:stearoyl-CoA desaturase (delta-9 desaturase)
MYFDFKTPVEEVPLTPGEVKQHIDWFQLGPYILIHLACITVIWVGWSWVALAVAASLYVVRVFALTAFYHRYFSHRAFKTSRWFQFVGGVLGNMAVQRGPLWWAAHHRVHHRKSDQPGDLHSPHVEGFFWSHMAWFITRENYVTNYKAIPDFAKYPELRFINRFEFLVPLGLGFSLFGLGEAMRQWVPSWGTNGWQMLVWGFVISTIAVYHVTYSINSLAHLFGSQRYPTHDQSRNNLALALVTFGEGWHNNHHHYPNSARQGFYWWEIDLTYYVLVALSWLGLVWDLRPVPVKVLDEGRTADKRSPLHST